MSASALLPELPRGGFTFDNYSRNEFLARKGFPLPRSRKTGTTIVGIVCADGVILGADTRATEGNIIADKNCEKIHYLAPNMYCCGAGTAADTEYTTKLISSKLELHALSTGKVVPVCAANRMLKQHLFKHQGHIGAALVLGGVDNSGPKLYSIHPHGSTDTLPYTTMGSGSLAAMAVFEARWKPNMNLEEGKRLVRDAIAAGIFNDLGSGSNIDVCIITKTGVQYLRPFELPLKSTKGKREGVYAYKAGATAVLATRVIPLVVDEVMIRQMSHDVETMDTN
ncbi:Proteasome subunit beta type-7 [Halotydeus destructor]|nr:Proteasome subunit beta type-7 [Halotydeus destructor]